MLLFESLRPTSDVLACWSQDFCAEVMLGRKIEIMFEGGSERKLPLMVMFLVIEMA